MDVNAQTKISDIIRHNKAAIDAIASIAPPLRRLKNPVLRKVMASRVTVAEAAKMGGCTLADFVRALQPIGFQFADTAAPAAASPFNEAIEKPAWLVSVAPGDIEMFDVRPIIANGTDPLKAIMQQFRQLRPGKILCIINSFVPTPLIRLLEKDKAESSFVEQVNEKEFRTYFLKKQSTKMPAPTAPQAEPVMHDEASFEKISRLYTGEKRTIIDVRQMEMPLPMQTILAALEELPEGSALYVHHKRVPVFLLEELASKDFAVHIYTIEEGNVKMLIFRDR